MDWLNYHHFLYFWVVAAEGTIVKASEKLKLAHPTISGQIHRLEDSLGVKLFVRRGRRLVLTEAGQVAFRYAEEIFSLGREFVDTLQGHASGKPLRIVIGVPDVLAPSLVRLFIEPALKLSEDIQIVFRSDKTLDEFLAELALHRIDAVFSDRPANPAIAVRAFSHLLGECGTTFFATTAMAKGLRRKFPQSLNGAPMVMPGEPSAVRRSLSEWFDTSGIGPIVVAECDESALAKDLGGAGMGVFTAPSVIEAEVKRQFGVAVVGRAAEVRQQFYAISVERRIKHPAVSAIFEAARNKTSATH